MAAKMTMTTKILIWMGAGLVLGSLINAFASDVELINDYFVMGLFHVMGSVYRLIENAGCAIGYFFTNLRGLWYRGYQ